MICNLGDPMSLRHPVIELLRSNVNRIHARTCTHTHIHHTHTGQSTKSSRMQPNFGGPTWISHTPKYIHAHMYTYAQAHTHQQLCERKTLQRATEIWTAYTHKYTHAHVHTYTHAHTHTSAHLWEAAESNRDLNCIHTHKFTHVHTCTQTHIHARSHQHICMKLQRVTEIWTTYTHTFSHINTHAHKHTYTHTHISTFARSCRERQRFWGSVWIRSPVCQSACSAEFWTRCPTEIRWVKEPCPSAKVPYLSTKEPCSYELGDLFVRAHAQQNSEHDAQN